MRAAAVLAHRYVGLVLAGFLLIAGVSGALLAWNDELEEALNPALFRVAPPAPGAPALDPLVLRERVAAAYPGAQVLYATLRSTPGRSVSFYLRGQRLTDDQIMLDPHTGAIVGARKWGDLAQGRKNLMPFIYRLHQSLALGVVGTYLFGIAALLWTVDCFVGAWLTLPARAGGRAGGKSWIARWRPAWLLRTSAGRYKLTYDLHRAGGLWCWAMLLVLAWSSVAFNLSEVYNPVMHAMLAHQPEEERMPAAGRPRARADMTWAQARETGRALMAAAAAQRGFAIEREDMLAYDPDLSVYRYDVRSSLDIRCCNGGTQIYFDAVSGRQIALWLPTGGAPADTVRTWITSVHMAALWGVPMKLFISLMGLAVAALSVTGVLVWRRKRGARTRRPG